jgi:hypothetical protein
VDILRTLNPGMPMYGLFGGAEQDFPHAKQLPLDHVWAIPLDDPHWKWVNGDLCVRWWYSAVGQHTTFDMLHLVDWDLILLESFERHFASVRDGIALTGITPMEQVYDTWSWVAPIRGRYEWLKLKAHVEHVYGYHQTPLAGFFCGASFSRQFLARYAQVEVPGWCNDEVRVPLFAQAFGLPVHDTRLGNEFFTAGAEMIAPSTVYAQYRQGLRSFHPVRERLALGEMTRVTRVRYVPHQHASDPMADPSSPIQFDDLPIDEARRMGRGPRIDPEPVSRPPGESPDDRARPLAPPTAPTADASPRPSKSQRKREAHAVQALGAQLVALPRAHLARIALPDALREAVVTAQGLRPHGARRRHLQYLGTLMRQLDAAELRRVQAALAHTRAVRPRPQPEPEDLGGPLTREG